MAVKITIKRQLLTLIIAAALVLVGGRALADGAGSWLRITNIEPGGNATSFVFNAVEVTDDVGLDGEAGTGDEGENDGFPDPGEELEGLASDLIVVNVRNEPRPGVDEGRPLTVTRVVLTYFDSLGQTPPYAPQLVFPVTLEIPPDGTGSLELVAVPYSMKVPADASIRGLRDRFLFPVDSAEFGLAQYLTVRIAVYAKDKENGDTTGDEGVQGIGFVNPNVGGLAD